MRPNVAGAVSAASSAEVVAIQLLIDQANLLDDSRSLNPNVRDVTKVRADLKREDLKPYALRDHAKVAHWQIELKTLKDDRDRLYRRAIRGTLLAYGLLSSDANGMPIMPTGTTVHPGFEGRSAHWIVVYKDDEARVLLENSGKRTTVPPGNFSMGGQTGADGITTMYGRFPSAVDLAILLFHERVHFEQFTTKGVGDKLIYDEREEKAYLEQYRNLKNFGLTPAELKIYEEFLAGDGKNKPGKIREHHEKAKIERRKMFVSLGKWGGAEPPSVKPRERAEYAALLEGSKDFDAQLEQAARYLIDQARKEKEAEERLRRPADLRPTFPLPHAPVELHPAFPSLPFDPSDLKAKTSPLSGLQFKFIAKCACAAPAQPFEGELASINWKLFQAAKEAEVLTYAEGLSACELRVFQRLMQLGRSWPSVTISPGDVRAAVGGSGSNSGGGGGPPSQNHDPVWGRVGPIIGRQR